MRPDIGDLLTGVRKTLAEVVFPTLTDPFALEQSTLILLALDHAAVRWDKAFQFCRDENTALRRVLREGAGLLKNEATAALDAVSLITRIEDRLRVEGTEDGADRSYTSLRDGNARLRELFVELLGARDMPTVQRSARAFMKRQLERDRDWVRIGELLW